VCLLGEGKMAWKYPWLKCRVKVGRIAKMQRSLHVGRMFKKLGELLKCRGHCMLGELFKKLGELLKRRGHCMLGECA
jgi:hypothetical protein